MTQTVDPFVNVESATPSIPHSRDAEDAVIGSVLINPETYHTSRVELPDGSQEFYIHRNRFIWQAFDSLVKASQPIDVLTVADELERACLLEEIGGPAYLTALVASVPNSMNAAAYAKIVHGFSTRRKVLDAANQVATLAFDNAKPLADVMSESTHAIIQAVASSDRGHTVSIADAVRAADKISTENGASGEPPGIPTPLIDLNRIMGGGAQKTDLNLLLGRPGMGKTSLVLQLARHACKYKVPNKPEIRRKRVAFFTLEMPVEQLTMRMLAQMTGIDYFAIYSGKIPENKVADYYAAIDELSSLDLVLDYMPMMRPSYIRSRCELIAADGGLDLVCVDSLNLMDSDVDFGSRTHEKVDRNAMDLKNIAGDFNIPFWVTHQMNRDSEKRGDSAKPTMADAREGGEQPATGMIFIHHEFTDASKTLIKNSSLIVAKQRNGPTGEIPVAFVKTLSRFENAYKTQA